MSRMLAHAIRAMAAAAIVLAASSSALAQGFIRDAEIEKILREYSDPIFEAAGLQPKDVGLYLIDDPSLNAFVAGGQRVHVNTGTITAADTPEQLKGVIAHETGHIAGGHNVTRPMAISASRGPALISIGLGVLAIAAGAPDAGVALLGSAPQFQLLTALQYFQNEESQADQYGVQFLAKTHQSAMGLVEFLEKFRYMEQVSATRRDPYFQSHPLTNERIGVLRARALEASTQARPQSQRDIDNLALMKAKLIGFLQPYARVNNKYPKTDLSIPARYARAIAAYRAVDIGAATREIDELIQLQPQNAYFYELKGQVLFENNRIEESIAPHRKSVEFAPEQPLLYVNLARSLIATDKKENIEEAQRLLEVALQKDRDNAFAWNQLASCYGKLKRDPEAQLATAEEAYAIGDLTRANLFSGRAMRGLKPNTPLFQRASDIQAVTDPRVTRRMRQGG